MRMNFPQRRVGRVERLGARSRKDAEREAFLDIQLGKCVCDVRLATLAFRNPKRAGHTQQYRADTLWAFHNVGLVDSAHVTVLEDAGC